MSLHLGQYLHLGLRQSRTSRPTRACLRSPEIPKKSRRFCRLNAHLNVALFFTLRFGLHPESQPAVAI